MKCCICGKEFEGYGNNPWPIDETEDARCCDDCNRKKVVPARFELHDENSRRMNESKNTSEVNIGDTIKINYMEGEPQYTGRTGEVTHIDDIGQIHGTWGGCAIIPGEDSFEIIKD